MHSLYSKREENKIFTLIKSREVGTWTRKVKWKLLKQEEAKSLHLKTDWTYSVYKDTGKTEAPQKVHIQRIHK